MTGEKANVVNEDIKPNSERSEAERQEKSVDASLMVAFQDRIRKLEAEMEEMRPVVDAAVEWRRDGYERKADFCVGISPLLNAIDIYDVGAPRPCEEL